MEKDVVVVAVVADPFDCSEARWWIGQVPEVVYANHTGSRASFRISLIHQNDLLWVSLKVTNFNYYMDIIETIRIPSLDLWWLTKWNFPRCLNLLHFSLISAKDGFSCDGRVWSVDGLYGFGYGCSVAHLLWFGRYSEIW